MKKKLYIVIAVVVLICLAFVCIFLQPALVGHKLKAASADLSDFLDNEGFIPGISQLDFVAQIGKYSYDGNCIGENLVGMYYDGHNGGGYQGGGSGCGFTNDYKTDQSREYAIYTNEFHTTVPLDNLTLPRNITFDDTLSDVCEKLGISSKNLKRYTNALRHDHPIKKEEVTLFKNKDIHFLLKRTEDHPRYDYALHYVETYITTRADGREATVTRKLIFYFDIETNKLITFQVSVSEKYKLD